MDIKLKGHSGAYKTETKGREKRDLLSSTPLITVCDPLAKVIVEETDGEWRVEKRFLLLEMRSEAPESNIQNPLCDDCIRQANELPG